VNGFQCCGACKDSAVAATSGGVPVLRFLKAGLYGFLAAVAGATLWITIVKVTNYEIGLVAIVVGVMVGKAVRAGAENRGGWVYQAMAIGLTYSAMVAYNVPLVINEFRTRAAAQAAAAQPVQMAAAEGTSVIVPASVNAPATESAAPSIQGSPAEPEREVEVGPAEVALGIAFILAIAFAAPFLAGFENIIGILILGFALYEAWKINRRAELHVSGPYKLSPVTAGADASPAPSAGAA
jgi:hypothetical protein